MSSRKNRFSSFRSIRLSMSRPWLSKIRMSTERASSGEFWTCRVAADRAWRAKWRALGMVRAERSAMLAPELRSPAISARLIIRAARDQSRLIATVLPRAESPPIAAPSLAANSGVNSMLERPVSP